MSRLSAASLRISESLDLGTVLHEIVDSARALTGARHGMMITTMGDRGPIEDFVTSGIPQEELREALAWPDAMRLYERLRDLAKPLRMADLAGYLRSLGLSPQPWRSNILQATPMYHRGVQVGSFYLADKKGGQEFTNEDEEVLTLFASQAATAIANARAYRDEHLARAGLEALIDTSPVGVVVLDARTGGLTVFNREARGLAERLGPSPAEVFEALTCRFGDGRVIVLREYPLAEQLGRAQRMRAEEVELSVPDGRSIKVLINATPIRGKDGEIESVIVTLQDLAPLEALERARTEFLSLVSHELRAPLTSIKGAAATLIEASSELDPAEQRAFARIIDRQANHMRGLIGDLLDAGRIDSGTLSVSPEPTGVGALVDRARNTFLSGGRRHAILIDLPPDLPPVMADRRRIVQVLNNLFTNAARHSPESSPIRVEAVRDGVHVAISVSDEGRGLAPERLPYLFSKHARGDGDDAAVRQGLGLAICKGLVEAHGGRIRAESAGVGRGACFTFTVPVAEEMPPDGVRGAPAGEAREERESTRILVIDDDPRTLRFVRDALSRAGFAPLVTGDPLNLPRLIRTERPALVLLDLMLPGGDGIELMEQLPELSELPVIFISGYNRDETMVRALEAGAADYIVKPFSPTELVARVRAALRGRAEADPFESGDLRIRYDRREVTLAGREVELTATEYELLRVLPLNAGRVVTTDTLLRRIWNRGRGGDSEPVRTFVKKLRRKLGDEAANPAYIFTERGVGYRMAAAGE
ncbi:MAG: response regulator [Gammaproteobacteria bacterium]|nr:response regulator [Gammaproteobacteria bacterium]